MDFKKKQPVAMRKTQTCVLLMLVCTVGTSKLNCKTVQLLSCLLYISLFNCV